MFEINSQIFLLITDGNKYLLTSSCLLILSGIFGDEGELFSIPRVDLLHYSLAGSNFFLSNGLLK